MQQNDDMGQGITLLQEIIDYIEANIFDDLTLTQVAKHFYMSSSLMNQLFKCVCNMTIMEYVRNRRLYLSGQELLTTKNRIIDIAFKYGYETPEAYTKAFTRFYGFPPSLVRRIYPNLKTFDKLHICLEIHGGFETIDDLTKHDDFRQDVDHSKDYNELTKINGGNSMQNQSCKYQIHTKEMKYKKDWNILLNLILELKKAGISFKVDGKTMIFAHGLEFELEKICLTFKWKEESKVLNFFHEKGEFKETFPGKKYYDAQFEGMKIRCLLYENFPGADTDEVLYENTDLVDIDGVIVNVQSLEFYYQNAKQDDVYYPMVEKYLNRLK